MSYDLARRLFEQAYKEEMPIDAEIQFANTAFQPVGTSYTRITIMEGDGSTLLAIGTTSLRRYAGIIDVAIFVSPDTGTKGLRDVAKQVEDALAHRSIYEGTTRLMTFGADFKPLGKQGDWYMGNVTLKYQRDAESRLSSLRTFAGRRLHTFAGQRLSTFPTT